MELQHFLLVNGLSMGPNMEVGGANGLIVGPGHSTYVELRELGVLGNVTHLFFCLPSMKICLLFSTFLIAWLLVALSHAKTWSNCKITLQDPISLNLSIFISLRTSCKRSFNVSSISGKSR